MSLFKKAEKSQVKLRIAITGPSGSGKTLGALLLAKGIHPNGKIAGIDTENSTMSLYGDRFDFDVASMSAPFLIKKYLKAINEISESGYDIGIVDSLSHAWNGEGGVLQRKEALDQKPGSNHFTNWGKMTPEQNALVNAVLFSKTDLICTMRSKTEYIMSERNGKQAPTKVGLAPVQRDGFEYEFDIVFDVDINHNASVSKDRTGMFAEMETFKLSPEIGKMIADWRASGKIQKKKSESVRSEQKIPKKDEKLEIHKQANKMRSLAWGDVPVKYGPYKNDYCYGDVPDDLFFAQLNDFALRRSKKIQDGSDLSEEHIEMIESMNQHWIARLNLKREESEKNESNDRNSGVEKQNKKFREKNNQSRDTESPDPFKDEETKTAKSNSAS